MVRLWDPTAVNFRGLIVISIPLWFDCEPSMPPDTTLCVTISIPLWFDCEGNCGFHYRLSELISIPLWFDCEVNNIYFFKTSNEISIPLWFDCEIWSGSCAGFTFVYFNSTMVRLWGRSPMHRYIILFAFQFHYGSIVSKVCELL